MSSIRTSQNRTSGIIVLPGNGSSAVSDDILDVLSPCKVMQSKITWLTPWLPYLFFLLNLSRFPWMLRQSTRFSSLVRGGHLVAQNAHSRGIRWRAISFKWVMSVSRWPTAHADNSPTRRQCRAALLTVVERYPKWPWLLQWHLK